MVVSIPAGGPCSPNSMFKNHNLELCDPESFDKCLKLMYDHIQKRNQELNDLFFRCSNNGNNEVYVRVNEGQPVRVR